MRKRTFIICIILAVAAIAVGLFLIYRFSDSYIEIQKYNSQDHIVDITKCRQDKSTLQKDFPQFGEILECKWDSGLCHKDTWLESLFNIGPSQYWVNGYAIISKQDMVKLYESYSWEPYSGINQHIQAIQNQLADVQDFIWMTSDEFDTSFNGYYGRFLIDINNDFIIFDLIKD